jgi:hypothetical protein
MVMLLCFFFGGIGVHRFYLGKIGTGILMIFTLGGLGIWSLIDFFIATFGNYNDSNGLPVSKEKSTALTVVLLLLIALYVVFLIASVFMAIQNQNLDL